MVKSPSLDLCTAFKQSSSHSDSFIPGLCCFQELPLPICIYRGRWYGWSRHMQWCYVTPGRQKVVTQGMVFILRLVLINLKCTKLRALTLPCNAFLTDTIYKPEESQGCSLSRTSCVSTFCLPNFTWNYCMCPRMHKSLGTRLVFTKISQDLSNCICTSIKQILEKEKIWKFDSDSETVKLSFALIKLTQAVKSLDMCLCWDSYSDSE